MSNDTVVATPSEQANVHEVPAWKLPETQEEFRNQVAMALTNLLSIPQNASNMACAIFAAGAQATQEQRERQVQEMTRAVVVRTYYKGAVRAIITAKKEGDETDNLLGVEFSVKNTEGEWVEPNLPEAPLSNLTKLVLSQSAQPGDVFYITTNKAIDQALEAATDSLQELSSGTVSEPQA